MTNRARLDQTDDVAGSDSSATVAEQGTTPSDSHVHEQSTSSTGPVAHDGALRRWRARWTQLSTRQQYAILGAVAVLVIALGAWAIVSSGDDEPAGGAARGGMAGMEGMAGMNMAADGSVLLTAQQIAEFGITFGTADMRMLESEVRTVGVVTFDETRIAQVAPKIGGFVERLYIDYTGQPVRRGQPVLEIYSPELVAAQQELLVARRLERTMDESAIPGVPAGSSNLLASARRRLQLWDVSEAQIDEVLRTGQIQRTLTLYSPASGVVVEKKVVRGQATMPGEQLYTIADLSEVWIDAELREADAGSIHAGSAADVEFAAIPSRSFKGRVEYVYPTLQEESRTVRARVAVANSGGTLKPGMYATVRLRAPLRSALTVPSSAVLRTGDRNIVFVDMGGGALMPHDAELGRSAGEYTEVLAGIEPGQRVVTSAQFLLDSESNLGEVMKAMMGQMGSGDMGNMKDMPGMSMPGMDTKGRDMKGMQGMDKGADMKGMKMPPSTGRQRP